MRYERFTVRGIDSEKLKKLRIYSVASDKRMDEIVNEMIQDFLDKQTLIDLWESPKQDSLAS